MSEAQLPLALPAREARGRGDLYADAATSRVLAELAAPWPGLKWALSGPAGSGKSHISQVWAEGRGARIARAADLREQDVPDLATGPLVVEDVPGLGRAQAAALFHLMNEMAGRRPLLLTGTGDPARWDVPLPDLASRIAAAGASRIEPPSDELLGVVLVKLFSERGLAPAPSLVAWLLPRMERDLGAAARLVADLDMAALSEGRAPSRAMAARIMGERAPREAVDARQMPLPLAAGG